MNRTAAVALLLCLGLLGVVAVGGTAGVSQQTIVNSGDAQTQSGVLDTPDVDNVEIDETLRDTTGEVEAIVSLAESERPLGPSGLQAHASETQQPLTSFAEAHAGVTVENTFWLTNAALVTVDTSSVSLTELAAVKGVQRIFENREFQTTAGSAAGSSVLASASPTADEFTYGLEQINAPTAWNTHNTTGEGASVAVLDTGVDADHPDLSVAKWQEFDSDGNPVDSQPNDGQGHGTHVSGTATGSANPAGDVPAFGVAPNADLYGVKVLDDSGGGSFAQVIAGMQWAVDENADVISMSLGATGYFDEMITPVQNAVNNGTIVVSSAGNSGDGSSGSPGNVYETIAVGASNSNGGIAGFSSGEEITTDTAWSEPPGSWPDQYTVPSIAAPGVDTLSSVPGGGYDDTYSGTSMSAPHVSGVVALAASALDKELSATEVEQALEATAFKPGDSPAPPGERDTRYGSGIVDANAAIAFLEGLEDEPFLTLTASGPATVEQNETLTVNYTVENLGGVEGNESEINLVVNDSVQDTDTDVTVGPNETVEGSLVFEDVDQYEEGELIDWTVEMVDTNTSSSGSTGVGLLPGTEIVIQSIDYADVVAPDGELNVEYTLENLGFEDGTESFVDLKVEGTDDAYDDTDSNVDVPGGETVTGTLTFDGVSEYFDMGDNITFTVELWDSGDVASGVATVEVPEDPVLAVESAEAPETVEQNETLTVNYTLGNSGGADGTESAVELVINGTVEDTDTNVTVPAQGTATGSLVFDGVDQYEEGDLIEWTVQAVDATGTATGSTAVGVLPGTEIVIQSIDYPDPVSPDGELPVDYTLENLGAETGEQGFVDLKVEGTDSTYDDTDTNVEVPGGGTTNGTLTLDSVSEFFDAGDTISFTVDLFASDGEASGNTTVGVPDEPSLSLVSVDAPVVISSGENLTVNYTIENIGGVEGTESAVELLVNGTVEDADTDVTVPAQGTANGTLVLENVDASSLPSSIAVEAGGQQVDTTTGIQIDRTLRDATGTVEAVVSLAESDRPLGPSGLQAHASETQQPLTSFAEAHAGVTVENTFWLTNAALVTVDTSSVSLMELAAVDGVQRIFENREFQTTAGGVSTPLMTSDRVSANDYTYGLEQINAPTAWNTHNTTGEGASVAVLDTGVDADHPDLSVAKWQEFDSDGNPVDSQPNDGQGHGTHVSGTATGSANPAGDVPAFGVAPNADLYGVKVLDDSGGGSFAQVIAGMQWAVDENADVISMSLGATGYFDEMITPVQNAVNNGTIVVSSAGNSGDGSSGSPGNVYETIAVGASNSNGGIAGFSSGEEITTDTAWSEPPGSWPDQYTVPSIAAPGVDTLSSVPGGGYDDTYSGTSMSAPHVSGVVALAASALDKELSATEVEQALEATAFKPGDSPAPPGERDTRYGSGIVDANAAIAFLEGLEDEPFLTLTASGPATVEQNETLTVNYTVENLGGVEGNESEINLVVNDSVQDTDTDVTVGPNETVEGSLVFEDVDQYEEGDLIDWTVEMVDTNTSSSGSTGVGLLPGTEIVIQSIDYVESLPPAGDLTVEYTLENLGFEDGTESFVDLKVEGTDDTYDDTDSNVDVPGGETVTGTLTLENFEEEFGLGDTITFTVELWDSGDVASGEAIVGDGEILPWTVSLADTGDSNSGEVLVEKPDGADFQITDAESNSPLAEGETLEVSATIENVGGAVGTQNVTAHIPGVGTNATMVELAPGESIAHTMTMELGTGPDIIGNHTMTVSTANHSTEMPIEVHVPAMPGMEEPPQDLDGNDLYEDVDGDGTLDVYDVQMLFGSYDDGMMDEHGWAFQFANLDDDRVSIFDVQALFNEL
jgi:subtilisin family serine protease